MHYQLPPHAEVKLVSCYSGAIWDVIVDLRPASRTYRDVASIRAVRENGRQLYIPAGFAHGFQALSTMRRQLSYIVVLRAGGLDGHPLRRSSRWHRVASSVTAISERDCRGRRWLVASGSRSLSSAARSQPLRRLPDRCERQVGPLGDVEQRMLAIAEV